MKNTIIYVYDGLCSWCYGFDSQMKILQEKLKDEYDFQLVSGGMFVGEVRHIKEILGENFRLAYSRVIEFSGANISEKYLGGLVEKDNYVVNSEIPATAFSTFKTYTDYPEKALEFVTVMQTNMYKEGLNPNEDELYKKTAEHFGINSEEFLQKMKTEETRKDAHDDFQYAKALQVNGFPQVFLKTIDEKYYLISRGFSKAENIIEILENIKNENN